MNRIALWRKVRGWFKYENGYVNYNDEFIFFSNSGNWKEIESTRELNKPIQTTNWKLILLISSTISLYFTINKDWKELSLISFLALLVSAGYAYLHHYKAPTFKVKRENIERVSISNEEITFCFLYEKGKTFFTIKEIKSDDLMAFLQWMRTYNFDLEDEM